MPSRMIQIAGAGAELEGYLSVSETGAHGPGVVVLHEWYGLTPHIKHVTDRLAMHGMVALAPDLYHGRVADGPAAANRLMLGLKRKAAEQELRATVAHVRAFPQCTGTVGVVGFGLGGGLALLAACRIAGIAACVSFYGMTPGGLPDCRGLAAPVLGVFAEQDPWVPARAIQQFERELLAMGRTVEIVTYAGSGHGFFNDTALTFDHAAAADAWQRTLAWLDHYLR